GLKARCPRSVRVPSASSRDSQWVWRSWKYRGPWEWTAWEWTARVRPSGLAANFEKTGWELYGSKSSPSVRRRAPSSEPIRTRSGGTGINRLTRGGWRRGRLAQRPGGPQRWGEPSAPTEKRAEPSGAKAR